MNITWKVYYKDQNRKENCLIEEVLFIFFSSTQIIPFLIFPSISILLWKNNLHNKDLMVWKIIKNKKKNDRGNEFPWKNTLKSRSKTWYCSVCFLVFIIWYQFSLVFYIIMMIFVWNSCHRCFSFFFVFFIDFSYK